MPVEIRELIVRAIITGDCNTSSDSNETCPDSKEILISECVERILQILKDREER